MKNTNINTKVKIFPENLHSILIGLMLGDGHIYKTSITSNSRFEMSFGKDRYLFAHSLSELFSDVLNIGVRPIVMRSSTFFNKKYNYRLKKNFTYI
jgi:hypothetical protein